MIYTTSSGVVKGCENSWVNYTDGIANVGIALLTSKDNNLYATSPGGEGVFISKDFGYSWENVISNGITHRWFDEIAVNPHDSGEIWAIADVGEAFITHNNGESWSHQINPYNGTFRYGSIYASTVSF